MHENMKYWEMLKQVPAACVKPIAAGRLKGMSDIKPQWRLQAMTNLFGPVGVGWKYVVVKKEIIPSHDGQYVAFVDVEIFVKDKDKWSDAIPGTGGSMFVVKEKAGLHTNDEAFKMALTDALSVAMKALGVAADIYLGAFDGSKYSDTDGITKGPMKFISEAQAADIQSMIDETGADSEKFNAFFKIGKLSEIPSNRYKEAISMLEKKRSGK